MTDHNGYYSIPNLLEGVYDLAVTSTGFKPYTQKGVAISINRVTRVDATIEIGAVNEQVTVEADNRGRCRQQGRTSASTWIRGRSRTCRYPATGTSRASINLVPGATPARFQNAVTDTPGRALSANVNGQERGANNTRVDGSADILVTMPHHAAYVPPAESIQQVNIATNNFDAEQGMTGGAAVTVITKSGTNDFHGSAFAMNDNSYDARLHVGREPRRLTEKPEESRNIGGGSLGGPIKRNKLFFFTDWEGTFERVNCTRTASRSDGRLPHR